LQSQSFWLTLNLLTLLKKLEDLTFYLSFQTIFFFDFRAKSILFINFKNQSYLEEVKIPSIRVLIVYLSSIEFFDRPRCENNKNKLILLSLIYEYLNVKILFKLAYNKLSSICLESCLSLILHTFRRFLVWHRWNISVEILDDDRNT
jgi:hypothetical protein